MSCCKNPKPASDRQKGKGKRTTKGKGCTGGAVAGLEEFRLEDGFPSGPPFCKK